MSASASANANTLVYDEKTANLILYACLKRNQRYSTELAHTFVQWKSNTEFPSKTNLYQKIIRFFQERVLEKSIPIFAKTMTGELIPLEYRPYCDKRDLLEQLDRIDSDQFSFGSTNIVRLVEDPTKPVEEGEIFALFQHDIQTVQYTDVQWCDDANVSIHDGPSISYTIKIKSNCFIHSVNGYVGVSQDQVIILDHLFEKNMIMSYNACFVAGQCSLDQIHELVRAIYYNSMDGRYYLTESAQDDLITLFNIIRRDI